MIFHQEIFEALWLIKTNQGHTKYSRNDRNNITKLENALNSASKGNKINKGLALKTKA